MPTHTIPPSHHRCTGGNPAGWFAGREHVERRWALFGLLALVALLIGVGLAELQLRLTGRDAFTFERPAESN